MKATPSAAVRSPSVQDAGLAAVLLAGTIWLPGPPARWAGTAVCVAAVALRRRWPLPALAAASFAALAQMALGAAPVVADLAVPITLHTIAARLRAGVSLALLGTALATVTAWSAYVALDGRTDGWFYKGPLGGGGQTSAETATGPTDWGGLPVLGSLLLVAWAIGWGVQSRRAYLAELERERDRQAELAVAAERARITRELHDVVAHGLAVIVMQAQGGAAALAKRPADTLAALDTIVATGRASLADMRQVLSVSGQADSSTRPVPGLAQLRQLADRVREAGTPVELEVTGSPRQVSAAVDVSAYRIVQEALTNIMKHAGPGAAARVVVSYADDELRLEVRDDGSSPAAAGETGSGLRGMRERASLLGGEVTAGPAPSGGYLVRAGIPLDPEAVA